MKGRFVFEWGVLTAAIGLIVPVLMFLATIIRMELLGDKPAETGQELENIEHLQWAIQLISYFVGVAAFSYLVLKFFKRK